MTTVTIPPDQYYVSETVSDAAINATAGDHIMLIYGTGDTVTVTAGNNSILAGRGGNTIVTGGGNNHVSVGGINNTLDLAAGVNTLNDQSGHNTIILPAAGQGLDTVFGADLSNGDTFDLRRLLSGTNWNGDLTSIANYLHVVPGGAMDFELTVSPSGSGGGPEVAHFIGQPTPTLATFLSHSVT